MMDRESNDISNQSSNAVDPDPFTVSMLWIAAASLLLQFIQVARQSTSRAPDSRTQNPNDPSRFVRLSQLGDTIRALQSHLKRLSRAIDRGAKEPESEFYDLKFRIGLGPLKLDFQNHEEFKNGMNQAFASIANMSLWINDIFAHNTDLAEVIGSALLQQLENSTAKLNEMIASGGSNRELVFESRRIIEVSAEVLSRMEDSN